MSTQLDFNFKCPPIENPTGVANFDFPEKDCNAIVLESNAHSGESLSAFFATLLIPQQISSGEISVSDLYLTQLLTPHASQGEISSTSLSETKHLASNLPSGETLNLFTISIAPYANIATISRVGESFKCGALDVTILSNNRTGEIVDVNLEVFESKPLVPCYNDGYTQLYIPTELDLNPETVLSHRVPYSSALQFNKPNYSLSAWVYLSPSTTAVEVILDRSGIYYQRWSSYSLLFNANGQFGLTIGSGTNGVYGASGYALKTHPRGYWYFIEIIKTDTSVTLFVNGNPEYTLNGVYNDANTSSDLILGSQESGLFPFNGKIKHLAFRNTNAPFQCGISAYDNISVTSSIVTPVYLNPLPATSGDTTTASLISSTLFNSIFITGESVPPVDLTTAIGRQIISETFTGEQYSTNLSCDITVFTNGQSGEISTANIQLSSILIPFFNTGEQSNTTLQIPPPIRFNGDYFNSDTLTTTTLLTSVQLDLDTFTGENLEGILTTAPSFGLNLNPMKTGASGSVSLVTYSLFQTTFAIKGSSVVASLEFPKAYGLSVALGFEGSLAKSNLKLGASNLQQSTHYSGESAYTESLSEEPLIIFYAGVQALSTLSTTIVIPLRDATANGSYKGDIETFKYTILPIIEYQDTAIYEWYIEVLKVTLNPRAKMGDRFTCDFYSTLDLSLESTVCCPKPTLNSRHAVIDFYPLPYDLRFDNRTITTLDLNLTCRHFIQSEFIGGERAQATLQPTGVNLSLQPCNADNNYKSHDNTMQYNLNLCRGQFNVVGYNLVIELEDFGGGACTPAYQYRTGELLASEIIPTVTFEIDYMTDTRLSISMLEVDYPMRIRGYSGEKSSVAFELHIPCLFQTDVKYTAKFYEPPYRAYAGESVTVDIISALAVRFLEEGCLTNDYSSVSDDGQAVAGRFNPVPVEGEPYYHWIKAECYPPSAEEIASLTE